MAVIRDVLPAFELFQPTTIDDAVRLVDKYRDDYWVLAGGLDSMDWLKDRLRKPRSVIDLSRIPELVGIKEANGGIEIGAMTPLTAVVRHPLVRDRFGLLAEAAELVASPQIRNQGTIGGNVSQDTRCWYYRGGWNCYRAGGNICYADTPTAINREHAILDAPLAFIGDAVDIPDPETPVGVRGVGEPPVGAAYGAIMNAIADAIGDEIFRKSPVSPDIILDALENHGVRTHDALTAHV